MYTEEQLKRYPYFEREIQAHGLEALLDPLTGIVSRTHIQGFVKALIDQRVPFSFVILDLDNFKFINDTYGHRTGDEVLVHMSRRLVSFLDGYGVAGRFGGDEYMIVNLRDRDYAEKKAFFSALYGSGEVLRTSIETQSCKPFITGTAGCATYPDDAADFDALFFTIDKALYRGKTKGRNCYIIYVAEKHRDIEIRNLARRGVFTAMQSLVRKFELASGSVNKLRSVTPLLMDELHISDLYYVGRSGVMRAVRDGTVADDVHDIDRLMDDDMFFDNALDAIERQSPVFFGALKKREAEAVLVVRVGIDSTTYGYLICAEPRSRRIWQEDECAILYFLAKLLAASVRTEGEDIDA